MGDFAKFATTQKKEMLFMEFGVFTPFSNQSISLTDRGDIDMTRTQLLPAVVFFPFFGDPVIHDV